MVHRLPLRLVLCVVLAGSASLAAVVGPVGMASGATTPLQVTCTSLSGGEVSQTLSGCTGNGAIAADAGTPPAHGTSVVAKRVITWSDGRQTAENYSYKDHTGAGDTCAARKGYTKEYLVTEQGKVAAVGTTTKDMIGGLIKATVCVYKRTATPHTIIVVNQGKITI